MPHPPATHLPFLAVQQHINQLLLAQTHGTEALQVVTLGALREVEIRALGAWLYEQQGFAQKYIQGLMGHADVKMTEHYQSGHGDDEVIYMKVKADLNV